jgi:peptidyl-prolyl cis-trans isomerase SurA
MKKSLFLALALVVPAILAAQQPPTPPPAAAPPAAAPQAAETHIVLNRVIASVGGVPITMTDVRERILQLRQTQGFVMPTDTAGWRKLVRDVVDGMIDEEVQIAKAAAEKVEVPDADVTRAVDAQIKPIRAQFPSDAEFASELAKAGLGTPAEYRRFWTDQSRRRLTQQYLIRKMREDGKLVPVNVTEKEVQDAYDHAKNNLPRHPATVTFRQIIINPKPSAKAKEFARVKAESLLAEINRGTDFERVAKRESMDPETKETGGDIGWHRRGEMMTEFDRWYFGLSPDQVSPVIETPDGYYILRVDRVNGPERKGRDILIRPVVDSSDMARTAREADSVRAQWLAGVPFDSLAKKHHDYANKEETGILTPYDRESLPGDYHRAFEGKKAGDIVVFTIPTKVANVRKVVVAKLESADEGGEYTLTELRDKIRQQLQEEGSMRRFLDGLRRLTYISMNLDAMPIPDLTPAKPVVP